MLSPHLPAHRFGTCDLAFCMVSARSCCVQCTRAGAARTEVAVPEMEAWGEKLPAVRALLPVLVAASALSFPHLTVESQEGAFVDSYFAFPVPRIKVSECTPALCASWGRQRPVTPLTTMPQRRYLNHKWSFFRLVL